MSKPNIDIAAVVGASVDKLRASGVAVTGETVSTLTREAIKQAEAGGGDDAAAGKAPPQQQPRQFSGLAEGTQKFADEIKLPV